MPASLPYETGQPVPAGYVIESRTPRFPLALGIALLGGGWVASMVAGTVTHVTERPLREDGGSLPLFIPLAGPFVTLGTGDPGGASTFWLWTAGLTQAAGLALIFAAFAGEEQRMVLRDPTPHQVMGLASPNARYMWPPEVRYDPEARIPHGYHVEERAMKPLMIAGALVFGVTYGVSALTAVTQAVDDETEAGKLARLFIPVAGPLATIEPSRAEGGAVGVLVADTIVQTTGVTLFLIGAATTRRRLVRDDPQAAGAERGLEPELDIGPGRVSLRARF
ncbi:MAG: hypothetical protein WKG00_33380 [Polyangiaceae bacterium]